VLQRDLLPLGVAKNTPIPAAGVIGVPKFPAPLLVRISFNTPLGVAPPPPPVEEIVIVPLPLVTVTFAPPVIVALLNPPVCGIADQ
jgi:hypothetical protein